MLIFGAFGKYVGNGNLGVAQFAGRWWFLFKKMRMSSSIMVSMYSCKNDTVIARNYAECVT